MGSCICNCCIGAGCIRRYVGSFYSDAQYCMSTSCNQRFAWKCSKITGIGGSIQAAYQNTSNAGTTIYPFLIGVSAVIGIICILLLIKSCCPKPQILPHTNDPPPYYDSTPSAPPFNPYKNTGPPTNPYMNTGPPINPYNNNYNGNMFAGSSNATNTALGFGAGLLGGALLNEAAHNIGHSYHHHSNDGYGDTNITQINTENNYSGFDGYGTDNQVFISNSDYYGNVYEQTDTDTFY